VVAFGPISLNGDHGEILLLDQALGDEGTLPVELVGAVTCLPEEHDASVPDHIDQRIVSM